MTELLSSAFQGPAEFLIHLAAVPSEDDIGLMRAAARCVIADEAANLLEEEALRSTALRDALLRKVVEDASVAVRPCHLALVRRLLKALAGADGRTSATIAYTLSNLVPVLPRRNARALQRAMLGSRFVGIRRRGYKSVERDKVPNTADLIAAWQAHHDPEAAWLLVKLLPAIELAALKNDLLPHLDAGWKLSRLYLNLAQTVPEATEELLQTDEVAYCYVLAKLGRRLAPDAARQVFERNLGDERLGLLVWSFGKMGLWEVLAWIGEQLPTLSERRYDARYAVSESRSE